ncbi:cell division protein FtsW [Candidatus Aerophobetes bacterium]|uniref:Probable peptidoglycan glycosyltransferase FtsW n=1 Tax=Aerophobetes bacterium TaxID=2030807 RepID=A0A2A4X1Z5_UNCAE|nr:MAG: cell division protein FtsW [Candidatus Aerophobetes bacterium]
MGKKAVFPLLLSVLLLFSIGMLMVFNTTSAEVIDANLGGNTYHAFFKQVSFALFSALFAVAITVCGWQQVMKYIPLIYFITLVLLVLVFIPGIGGQVNGAYRWIRIAGFSFQPSELMKLAMPLYFIELFTAESSFTIKRFYKIAALFSFPLLLIFLEPDNGTVFIILLAMMALVFLCRVPLRYWLLPLASALFIGAVFAWQMPHVKRRVAVYLHPEKDIYGKGHQPYQAKIATGSGQLYGKGFGKSLQKLNYLPEARSDYIAAIFAEEFGFLGVLFIILLYVTLAISGFFIALRADCLKSFLVVSIIIFLITIQAFLNLGVVSGLLPSKGTNLPFFSQGGSSLWVNTAALMLVYSIAKKPKRHRDTQEEGII